MQGSIKGLAAAPLLLSPSPPPLAILSTSRRKENPRRQSMCRDLGMKKESLGNARLLTVSIDDDDDDNDDNDGRMNKRLCVYVTFPQQRRFSLMG